VRPIDRNLICGRSIENKTWPDRQRLSTPRNHVLSVQGCELSLQRDGRVRSAYLRTASILRFLPTQVPLVFMLQLDVRGFPHHRLPPLLDPPSGIAIAVSGHASYCSVNSCLVPSAKCPHSHLTSPESVTAYRVVSPTQQRLCTTPSGLSLTGLKRPSSFLAL